MRSRLKRLLPLQRHPQKRRVAMAAVMAPVKRVMLKRRHRRLQPNRPRRLRVNFCILYLVSDFGWTTEMVERVQVDCGTSVYLNRLINNDLSVEQKRKKAPAKLHHRRRVERRRRN